LPKTIFFFYIFKTWFFFYLESLFKIILVKCYNFFFFVEKKRLCHKKYFLFWLLNLETTFLIGLNQFIYLKVLILILGKFLKQRGLYLKKKNYFFVKWFIGNKVNFFWWTFYWSKYLGFLRSFQKVICFPSRDSFNELKKLAQRINIHKSVFFTILYLKNVYTNWMYFFIFGKLFLLRKYIDQFLWLKCQKFFFKKYSKGTYNLFVEKFLVLYKKWHYVFLIQDNYLFSIIKKNILFLGICLKSFFYKNILNLFLHKKFFFFYKFLFFNNKVFNSLYSFLFYKQLTNCFFCHFSLINVFQEKFNLYPNFFNTYFCYSFYKNQIFSDLFYVTNSSLLWTDLNRFSIYLKSTVRISFIFSKNLSLLFPFSFLVCSFFNKEIIHLKCIKKKFIFTKKKKLCLNFLIYFSESISLYYELKGYLFIRNQFYVLHKIRNKIWVLFFKIIHLNIKKFI
jgi:hypothetical protein